MLMQSLPRHHAPHSTAAVVVAIVGSISYYVISISMHARACAERSRGNIYRRWWGKWSWVGTTAAVMLPTFNSTSTYFHFHSLSTTAGERVEDAGADVASRFVFDRTP
jgi:hypothetical protein